MEVAIYPNTYNCDTAEVPYIEFYEDEAVVDVVSNNPTTLDALAVVDGGSSTIEFQFKPQNYYGLWSPYLDEFCPSVTSTYSITWPTHADGVI